MKRLWLALGMLAAVTTLCIVSLCYQRRQTAVLLERLDVIEECYDAGDVAQALRLAEDYTDEHNRRTYLLSCFMNHAELTGSTESASVLSAALRENDSAEFRIELARLRTNLHKLQKSEIPNLQNIL